MTVCAKVVLDHVVEWAIECRQRARAAKAVAINAAAILYFDLRPLIRGKLVWKVR